MRAHGRERHVERPPDLLVAQPLGEERANLGFARGQAEVGGLEGRGASATQRRFVRRHGVPERAGEHRFDDAQQLERGRVEIAAPPRAPDPQVADVAIAVVGVEVDPPVEPVAREEVIEELGPQEVPLRHDFDDERRVAPLLELEGNRVVELVVGLVAREVRRVHVERNAVGEDAALGVPHVGGEVIGLEQLEEVEPDLPADLTRVEIARQVIDGSGEQSGLSRSQVNGRPPRRPDPAAI